MSRSAPPSEPKSVPVRALLSGGRRAARFLASLPLTVALLVLSILLVFAATLDQVNLGVWGVQEKYFHSFFVFAAIPGTSFLFPVFPGGYLLGGALLVNLAAAHLSRFRFAWGKVGIWLVHLGLVLLIVGEGLSGLLQQDDQMRIDVGQTQWYAESLRDFELAVVDTTNPKFDRVVSIPASRLGGDGVIQTPLLPFGLKPMAYYPNAALRPSGMAGSAAPSLATMGAGTGVVAQPEPATVRSDQGNWPAAYVELEGPDGPLGVWLVSAMMQQPQAFTYEGRTWDLVLRPRRDYLPFSLTLGKFTHDVYPGTDIPKNFASTVRLEGEGGRTDRRVVIRMNDPLRFGGRAFYQAGYANNDRTTVLQVVRNPSWRVPYLACAMMAVGLVLQFGAHLLKFFRRRRPAAAQPA
jgi:ResB-like family